MAYMKIKTRLIILAICVMAFLVVTPYIVLYSLGYRVNFETWKVQGTGGIYVYAEPNPSVVLIDSKPASESGFFSTSVFVQNLMPGLHSVLIQKDGYYEYQKTLPVKEKEVTKLENVTLFIKNIAFSNVPLEIGVNAKTQFATLAKQTTPPRISPDGRKRIYYDAHEIYSITFEGSAPPALVHTSLASISKVFWLNNDYLVILTGGNITISEIDTRGNINKLTLPQKADDMFFNQQDKKLYVLEGTKLLVSERLVP